MCLEPLREIGWEVWTAETKPLPPIGGDVMKNDMVAFPVRLAVTGSHKKHVAHALHVRADWALGELAHACVLVLYLIAVERLARIVESLKRAGERVIEEWPLANH